MNYKQLLDDLQKIHNRIDEGYVEEADELLGFVIGEINIKANQQDKQLDRLTLLEAVAKAAKILVAAENRNDYTSYQSRYTIIRQAKESVEAALEAYEAAKG